LKVKKGSKIVIEQTTNIMKTKTKLKYIELFAGVGGFRLGLEGWQGKSALSNYQKDLNSNYEIVWSNQWEPATKLQHASNVYVEKFGEDKHSNDDVASVSVSSIPNHDLLVGGFPCQDYSVAKQLSKATGIEGKKGVLWWAIHNILVEKKQKPNYILLENVDRLIKSPAKQRGRDFAIILASLADLGYAVEWRVINAADYGMPQRRRRVFIFAFHKNSPIYKKFIDATRWITDNGLFAKTFPITVNTKIKADLFADLEELEITPFNIQGDLVEITKEFNKQKGTVGVFENSGVMVKRQVWTLKTVPKYNGPITTLGDLLVDINDVKEEYFLNDDIEDWKYLKGSKKEERKKSNGEIFYYVEGPMSFPDPLNKPARTIITSEGGKTASRFKHVVEHDGRLRRLMPVELERANMFPDNHTSSANDTKRAFFMGNALVVGVIEKLGNGIVELIES
jgi:DNA (cytosine-5)-methyltransferase 1